MFSLSYHFTNVLVLFYQQALKFLVLIIALVLLTVNFLQYSKVVSYILNTGGIITCTILPNHPFISVKHQYFVNAK